MIRFSKVSKVYPPHLTAISSLDLTIEDGEFLFIAGASGAGKSTILKLLLGSEVCSAGEVIVLGRNMHKANRVAVSLLRREIGIVFQDYRLLPNKTVLENVAIPLELRGVPPRTAKESAHYVLESVGLEDRASYLPRMLSGGEQQRVGLARALVVKPKLLLADEPTGNLDVKMTRIVFDLLLEANASGITVIVATHNLAVIEELNLRTIVLDKGKIIGDFDRPGGASQ